MYWKTMFDRCYCIISTKCSVTFAKNVALYFILLTFDSQHLSAPFFINIRLPGPRASIDPRWPSSDSTLMLQKKGPF